MPNLSPRITMPTHSQEPAHSGVWPTGGASPPQTVAAPPATLPHPPSSVALSFAFDSMAQTLNVVMTDERSGEVVRTMAYTHLPADVHRSDQLHGLLLDQLA